MVRPLASMSIALRLITYAVMPLPFVFAAMTEQEPLLYWVGIMLIGVYLGIWLFLRPSCFSVTPEGLDLRWPLRGDLVPHAKIQEIEVIDYPEFRRRKGFAVRVGAGGLWGVFGYLKTTRGGWVRAYISRSDGLLLITLREGAPLLISPEEPEDFAAALEAARVG